MSPRSVADPSPLHRGSGLVCSAREPKSRKSAVGLRSAARGGGMAATLPGGMATMSPRAVASRLTQRNCVEHPHAQRRPRGSSATRFLQSRTVQSVGRRRIGHDHWVAVLAVGIRESREQAGEVVVIPVLACWGVGVTGVSRSFRDTRTDLTRAPRCVMQRFSASRPVDDADEAFGITKCRVEDVTAAREHPHSEVREAVV